jgi:hypothetical protein
VAEKKSDADLLRETVSSNVGSLESRAAAKLLGGRMPVVISLLIGRDGPLDDEGCATGPIKELKTAQIGDKILTRDEGESAEDFERRAIAETPALAWGFIRMSPGEANEEL